MANFGNFNAALSSFRAEATNALVNVNLEVNFSKKIIPPPPEYALIGKNMTPSRLYESQEGSRHMLARKLGLLFRNRERFPPTANLIKAYGKRASEIVETFGANHGEIHTEGLFAEAIGADSTTLWAAATSGRSAIQCHLLACLLARMWSSGEATSIWVEIIEKRRAEIELQMEADGDIDSEVLLAARSEFRRSDIRDWDASARAWLRVADKVMAKQQTQLRLIIENISLPVNSKNDTFDSVMEAWMSAMEQMELLLRGTPLQVHQGDVLLGLLSWHLYPDMRHLSTTTQDIKQNDSLLQGRGILSLGLEPSPRMLKDAASVYWALPLAYLRFYGRLPVNCTRSVRISEYDRLTVDEMLWAVLSAYFMQWDNGDVPSQDLLQYIINVAIELHWACGYEQGPKTLQPGVSPNAPGANSRTWTSNKFAQRDESWLTMIARVMVHFKSIYDEPRVKKLRNMGQRFYPSTLNPFQGIFTVETFLKAARKIEDKINLLRAVAKVMATQTRKRRSFEFLIVYEKAHLSPKGEIISINEFATGCKEHEMTEDGASDPHSPLKHRRWIEAKPSQMFNERLEEIRSLGESADYVPAANISFHRISRNKKFALEPMIARGKRVRHIPDDAQVDLSGRAIRVRKPDIGFDEYHVVHGDLKKIALMQRLRPKITQQDNFTSKEEAKEPTYSMGIAQIVSLFTPDKVDFSQCAFRLDIPGNLDILGLTLIESLYRTMGDATVDVRAVRCALGEAHWLQSLIGEMKLRHNISRLDARHLTEAEAFSCIAMMETGEYNIRPEELGNVFALSAEDSLYIASAILEDPVVDTTIRPITRMVGNIGKAGMAFLVPPKDTETKSYDAIDEWYRYDHKDFDGVVDDCFEGTSLHLSFSEALEPISFKFSGVRDIAAYFLEALVSVYERDTWIAELDILQSLRSQKVSRNYLQAPPCHCRPSQSTGSRIISVDNFAEIIVPPKLPGIIRAKGNWQARLVAASICISKGYRIILRPEEICWNCFRNTTVEGCSVQNDIDGSSGTVMIL